MRCLTLLTATLMITGCASSESYTRPPLPGNLIDCVEPAPPKGNHFDDIALALGDAVTRFYECKTKHDAVVGLWAK